VLADGSVAQVKRVSARVENGHVTDIVYDVETMSGAWAEARPADVRAEDADRD